MMMSVCSMSWIARPAQAEAQRLVTARPSIEATRTRKRGRERFAVQPIPQHAGGMKHLER